MKRNICFFVSLFVLGSPVSGAYAQKLDTPGFGSPYYSAPDTLEKKPIAAPRTFSSQLTEEEPALELDRLYYRLTIALLEYARADATHQERLMELMAPYRFEMTRYAAEFEGDMAAAMDDLNAHYKDMREEIEKADKDFVLIRHQFSKGQHAKVDALWEKHKALFVVYSKKYFDLQHDHLKAYKRLVRFILERPGTYYYNAGAKNMSFNDVGAYRYFGQSIDNLKYIARKKRDLLEEGMSGSYEEPLDMP
jgi:hypothetical protein